jgi:hypothetical protein
LPYEIVDVIPEWQPIESLPQGRQIVIDKSNCFDGMALGKPLDLLSIDGPGDCDYIVAIGGDALNPIPANARLGRRTVAWKAGISGQQNLHA